MIPAVHEPSRYAPRLPMDPPLCTMRDRLDEAVDILDTIESAKQRCKTIIVAAEVDAVGTVEGVLGFKGDTQDCADLLAELIMRFTECKERSALLYKSLRTLQSQQEAKRIQADLDAN